MVVMDNLWDPDHLHPLNSGRDSNDEDRPHNFDIAFNSVLSREDLGLRLHSESQAATQDTNGIEDSNVEESRSPQMSAQTTSVRLNLISQIQHWGDKHGFSGWRFGVLTGLLTTLFVLVSNIILLLLGAFRYGGYQNGISVLARGSSPTIAAISAAYHVFINVLSTLLLGASNYSMQVLTSPTRDAVDLAHEKGKWLDIGILSFRNLRCISRLRFWLWFMLAASSVPLHLFYNSAVFEVTASNNYAVYLTSIANETEMARLSAMADKLPDGRLKANHSSFPMTRLDNTEWRNAYDRRYVSQYSDMYWLVDVIGIRTPFPDNLTAVKEHERGLLSSELGSFDPFYEITLFTTVSADAGGWVNWTLGADWWVTWHVESAIAKKAPAHESSVQISRLFMLIVILFNTLKGVAMVILLLDRNGSYLVTCGDAVASFMEHPQPLTEGYCVASKGELCNTPPGTTGKLYKRKTATTLEEAQSAGGYNWRPRNFTWGSAISTNRRLFTTAFCGILLVLGIIVNAYFFRALPYGWAASSGQYFNQMGVSTTNVLLNAWLANVPQLVLSAVYLTFNTLYTSIALAQEWNRMAAKRKGLRVTAPEGEQRSTYFLQLPYRWAVPLMATSGSLHWLLSQTMFLVRIDTRGANGVRPGESISACGFSRTAFVAFTCVGSALCVVTWAVSLIPMRENIPLAASCSAMISAACHPPGEDQNAHLKKVQWGVTTEKYGGIGHCTFTSQPVTKPVPGEVYA